MNIKEKLLKLKEDIFLIGTQFSRDYEFTASLKDHPIDDQNIYRLYYVNYHRIGEYYGTHNNIGMMNWQCKPFMLPNGMTREEGFKVLSYLTDFIEKKNDIETCSIKSVMTLDGILDLEKFGFIRVKEDNEDKILNLFIVDGRLLLFKKSELYSKYFEWYVENVTLEEITNIYAKCNKKFEDIIWTNRQNNKIQSKVLKR